MDLEKIKQVVSVVIAIFIISWVLFMLSLLAYKITLGVLDL